MLLDVIPNRKKPFVPGYHSPSPLPRIKGRSKTRRTLAPIQRRRPPPLPQSARNAVPVAPSGMKIQGRQEPPRSGGRVWIFHCSVVRIRKPGIMKGRIWLFGQSSRRGGRAVECGGLENRFTRNPGNEGSNPSSSASNPAGSETGLLLFFPRVANRAGPIPTLSCGNAHRS